MTWVVTSVGMVLSYGGPSRVEREGSRVALSRLHGMRAATIGNSLGFLP